MHPDKAAERVLVIPAAQLPDLASYREFRSAQQVPDRRLFDPTHYEFRARGEVESDPTYLQLIPYVVLTCGEEVFHYVRRGGSETRLDARRSIGIGGHINAEDATGSDIYRSGMMREVREEIELYSPYAESWFGVIYDDSTEVGRVHLGVVHWWRLEEPLAFARESTITDAAFTNIRVLRRERSEFETWSQWVLDALVLG